jgi:hypothetical protein
VLTLHSECQNGRLLNDCRVQCSVSIGPDAYCYRQKPHNNEQCPIQETSDVDSCADWTSDYLAQVDQVLLSCLVLTSNLYAMMPGRHIVFLLVIPCNGGGRCVGAVQTVLGL